LVITHYRRILERIIPDFVHVMYKGRIVLSGGAELVEKLEAKGYDWVKEEYGFEEEEHAGILAGS
jgi:Fe-S cluster assembly ATP-binding protein